MNRNCCNIVISRLRGLIFYIVVSGLVLQVSSLKNVRLRAAEAVKTGERLRLGCNYELESAPLYSVKWYFGDNEFYRFVPKESPPTRVFPLDGFNVDLGNNNDEKLNCEENVGKSFKIDWYS